jgi:tRNA A37 threonylcarbamoyladenosine dehydratase
MLQDKVDLLKGKTVAVFGVGGVGGYTVEALIRSGIENIDIYDFDSIDVSNINRQLIANTDTVGKIKVEEWVKRAHLINPNININGYNMFVDETNISSIDFNKYDYVVDAIDTVNSKIELIIKAKEANTPIISCLGTGNKLKPELFEISDIYKTSVCPLARSLRYELKKLGIKNLKVLYSKETPIKAKGQRIPASISFVPPVAGLLIAEAVIKDLIGEL